MLRARLFAFLVSGIMCCPFGQVPAAPDSGSYRILHVMSYHATWAWNQEQLHGFKSAFTGVDVDYKVVELDTKRQSEDAAIREKAAVAKRLVGEWKPHLIYTNDDNAQAYFAKEYAGSDIPIVFSGVNRDPSEYEFIGARNVTGVIEQEHLVPTLKLLRRMVPEVRRIAVIVDADPTWKGVMSRMRGELRHLPDIEVTEWALVRTIDEFKEKVREYQGSVDAIAMLGIFNIKDASGNDVDYEQVLRWTVEHSRLPDFSFWQTRVERGTLCAVAVSGFEQGLLAGQMARKILIEGVEPAAIQMQPSTKGQMMVSLARAKKLGLAVDVNLLLEAKVVADFAWDR